MHSTYLVNDQHSQLQDKRGRRPVLRVTKHKIICKLQQSTVAGRMGVSMQGNSKRIENGSLQNTCIVVHCKLLTQPERDVSIYARRTTVRFVDNLQPLNKRGKRNDLGRKCWLNEYRGCTQHLPRKVVRIICHFAIATEYGDILFSLENQLSPGVV